MLEALSISRLIYTACQQLSHPQAMLRVEVAAAKEVSNGAPVASAELLGTGELSAEGERVLVPCGGFAGALAAGVAEGVLRGGRTGIALLPPAGLRPPRPPARQACSQSMGTPSPPVPCEISQDFAKMLDNSSANNRKAAMDLTRYLIQKLAYAISGMAHFHNRMPQKPSAQNAIDHHPTRAHLLCLGQAD